MPAASPVQVEGEESLNYAAFLEQHQEAFQGLGEVARPEYDLNLVDEAPFDDNELFENSGSSLLPNALLSTVLAGSVLATFAGSSSRTSEFRREIPNSASKKKNANDSEASPREAAPAMALGMLALSRKSPKSAGRMLANMKRIRPSLVQTRSFSFSTSQINHQSASAARAAVAAPRQNIDVSQIVIPDIFSGKIDPTPEQYRLMTDEQLVHMINIGKLAEPKLEKILGDFERAVRVRRLSLMNKTNLSEDILSDLAYEHYNYEKVHGQCCENVLGYVQVPVGIVGPIRINEKDTYVPMATTEGCLVASTQRGSKALNLGGGVKAHLLGDGMTRAPLIRMPSVSQAAELKAWVETEEGLRTITEAFESSSRFAKLAELRPTISGRHIHLRFKSRTGDAMGMNMISKGCERAMEEIQKRFPESQVMSLSGNMCTDKKPSAINWIEGRGKSVSVEATIPKDVVESVLKTRVDDLIDLNLQKNLVGSVMAGSIGGFNAHAANIVTAVYIACGQDPAQNVESSTCITMYEKTAAGDLYVTATMPSIEVGTVGGGTSLPGQSACLSLMGVKGAAETPGANAQQLALNVASTVLAGELSLMSALAAGHLVKAHMEHNRKPSTN